MPTLLEAIRLKYGACADDEWPSAQAPGAPDGSASASASAAAAAAPAGAETQSCAAAVAPEGEGLPVAIFVPRRSPRRAVPALLVLNDCGIEAAGDARALRSACRAVEELDLAQNRLARWREVLGILQQAPRVRFLNLSFNSLAGPLRLDPADGSGGDADPHAPAHAPAPSPSPPPPPPAPPGDANGHAHPGPCPAPPPPLPPLRALVLNGTRVSWDSVARLLALLPGLEELHLSLNELREVCLGAGAHAALRRLFFNRNPVGEWAQVAKLGAAFPRLEALSLADCPLRSLRPTPSSAGPAAAPGDHDDEDDMAGDAESQEAARVAAAEAAAEAAARELARSESAPEATQAEAEAEALPSHHFFRRLRCLNVSGTLLAGWEEVDRLARFPALTALRISGCPLLEAAQEHTQYERRQLLIARLPNVRTLNGGGLISSEEREDAERAFIRYYMDKPEVDRPERYNDLVAVHGRLDPLVQVDLSPEKRVKVHVTCGEQSEVRCLHVYQTVADLKQKLESFTGIPAGRMRLFYVDQAMRSVHGPEEMRYPSKRLYSYNIANGDEIIVDVKQRTTERTLSTSSTGSTSSSNNNNSSSNISSNNSNGSSNGVNNNLR
ncbi:hypothetical protein R5R35_009751 [Gryllus longicercus]|uniref:Ubiquitin-like domain-containing protein n=1 Tax=Gryllus longicercus TaxID=2509291 RepID=A0AAN9VVH0_9ORTH